ncbi:MAG TPA: YbdD/YjiX family protein [Gemmatimonadales bacterium]|jgi:uncharacterized short protein YbdD (DUF466 family)
MTVARLVAVIKRICGMPDYAAYVAHLAAEHPERTVPTEREFTAAYQKSRYEGGANRCC